MHYGMAIDLRRCIGCQSCTTACKVKNGMPSGAFLSKVIVREVGEYPNTRIHYIPMLCMQCMKPACLEACPTGATTKRADGVVTIDTNKCIGCKYCIAVCPYEARVQVENTSYYAGSETVWEKNQKSRHPEGRVVKCDFCISRLEADKKSRPLCVQTCPTQARVFGDLDDPNSDISKLVNSSSAYQIHAELGTAPSIYYLRSE